MTKQKSFFTELCKDAWFYLALTVIAITSVGLAVGLADWLAWVIIEHGEFMRRMAIDIMFGISVWGYVIAVIGALILFGIAVRCIINIWK